MHIDRDMTIISVPLWYRIALRGSVFGIMIGTIVAVIAGGWLGLLVLLLTPLLFLFKLVDFEIRTITVRIGESFAIIEHDRTIEIPNESLKVRERFGARIALEVSFPYHGSTWKGIIAQKDAPGTVLASASDDPALYARIRATLRS
jgi:hypothetical protein